MPKAYASEPSKLLPAKISRSTYAATGRLVQAFAQVEDLVKLYICLLAEISESKALILLGRTPLSKQIEIAEALAELYGKHVHKMHKAVFVEDFFEALACRNAVAHGRFLGRSEDGRLAFQTAAQVTPEDSRVMTVVATYLPESISDMAHRIELFIPYMIETLKLQPLLDTRRGQGLGPHPKGLKQPSPNDKRKPPPRS